MVKTANSDIPVLLLTGYLGSGKTTLVNRILSNRKGIRFAVIVNDLGEINIDAELIQQGGVVSQTDDNLIALQNGCICCTLKNNLIEQLRDIVAQNRFDYIVIEASGICEPEPIAQTICSIPYLEDPFPDDRLPRLDCIVTVVDAVRMRDEFQKLETVRKDDEEDLGNLIIEQIEFCNLILLNKASEVSPDELGRTKALIRSLQQKAEILPCDYGEVPMERLLDTGLFDFDKTSASATWIREVENIHDDDEEMDEHEHEHEHEHEEHHHHHHHHDEEGEAEEYGIRTYVYQTRSPFRYEKFHSFVRDWLSRNAIRSKGICYFSYDQDLCYIFDQVGKSSTLREAGQWFATMPPDELGPFLQQHPEVCADWDDTYGDRMQKLVFIGQHLDTNSLCSLLDQCKTE
ncbi:MAG: GTP-binding protein [Bacteroidales bacterium]|nr:GTP-binding protein [Bacteroidales bacterium]